MIKIRGYEDDIRDELVCETATPAAADMFMLFYIIGRH